MAKRKPKGLLKIDVKKAEAVSTPAVPVPAGQGLEEEAKSTQQVFS